jgi:hypothetical protein
MLEHEVKSAPGSIFISGASPFHVGDHVPDDGVSKILGSRLVPANQLFSGSLVEAPQKRIRDFRSNI